MRPVGVTGKDRHVGEWNVEVELKRVGGWMWRGLFEDVR